MLEVGEGYVQCWSSCDLAGESSEQTVCAVPPCYSLAIYVIGSTHYSRLYPRMIEEKEAEKLFYSFIKQLSVIYLRMKASVLR